ncbi:MAG: right-handed parallel beta-helix repeat-containing protein [Candidatus Binatia bacterium]
MIRVEKRLTILSRDGAATTVLSPGGASAGLRVVCLLASGITFGKPKKGFTIRDGGDGVRVGSSSDADDLSLSDVVVSGNRSIHNLFHGFVVGGRNTLIKGNQAVDHAGHGFVVGGTANILTANVASGNGMAGFMIFPSAAAVQLRGNAATGNETGFVVNPPNAVVTGCVASGNLGIGFLMRLGTGSITKSAAIGNGGAGIDVGSDGPDVVSDCTVVGNGTASSPNCGVENISAVPVNTTNVFWGSASGPGADPSDNACATGGGAIGVLPVATKEVKVKPKLPAID